MVILFKSFLPCKMSNTFLGFDFSRLDEILTQQADLVSGLPQLFHDALGDFFATVPQNQSGMTLMFPENRFNEKNLNGQYEEVARTINHIQSNTTPTSHVLSTNGKYLTLNMKQDGKNATYGFIKNKGVCSYTGGQNQQLTNYSIMCIYDASGQLANKDSEYKYVVSKSGDIVWVLCKGKADPSVVKSIVSYLEQHGYSRLFTHSLIYQGNDIVEATKEMVKPCCKSSSSSSCSSSSSSSCSSSSSSSCSSSSSSSCSSSSSSSCSNKCHKKQRKYHRYVRGCERPREIIHTLDTPQPNHEPENHYEHRDVEHRMSLPETNHSEEIITGEIVSDE